MLVTSLFPVQWGTVEGLYVCFHLTFHAVYGLNDSMP